VTDIALDRMAVDEEAASPERAAAEIHRQLGMVTGAVPVFEIARALDIEQIDQHPLRGFEAMLLTAPERDFGHVILNCNSNARRRRYSLAHELGHFLCTWHRQSQQDGFACSRGDMVSPVGPAQHIAQEREANVFAIELLAPGHLVLPFLKRLPDLDVILALHKRLDISKVAAGRRYVSLHSAALALVVAKSGQFLYAERSERFPFLPFERGDRLPVLPPIAPGGPTSEVTDADPAAWRLPRPPGQLFSQVLEQEDSHALILLQLDIEEPE